MNDIGVVSGVIELTDNFTSEIGLAEAALHHFTVENQTSLLAVAGAVGLVTAAFGAAAAAVYNLGQRGADVNDVEQTLEHFSGTAAAAAANLEALRKGTMGTVDDFELMKSASHMLSAGVKLNTDDFNTLGSAAFVLQNRGLGGTKEMMDLVSNAMVTGRTRALAMKLGVVDVGDAEQKLAERLGVTVDMLTDEAKAEAKRTQIMTMLRSAVKDAGVQERDFGEQIEFVKTQMMNWTDQMGQAIAKSPALSAAMAVISNAVGDAFGGTNQDLIKEIMEWVKSFAVVMTDVGLATIETARVANVVWSAIKTLVLGTTTVIVASLAGISEAVENLAKVGEALHILPEGSADAIKEVRVKLEEMYDGMVKETAEAAKGLAGHSDFDKTLDKLGGTMFRVRDALVDNKAAHDENNKVVDIAANNAKKLAGLLEAHNKIMVDQKKVTDLMIKSTKELNGIWEDYFLIVAKNSGTSQDALRAGIEGTFRKQVDALEALDPLYREKYAAYEAIAKKSLEGIASDWGSVKDKSIEALQQEADKQRETYTEMLTNGLHFHREVLDAQLQKVHDTADAARGMGTAFKDAYAMAAQAAEAAKKKAEAVQEAAEKAHKAMMEMGGSEDVTSANFDRVLKNFMTNGGWNPSMQGVNQYKDPYALAKEGYSMEEILKYAFNSSYQGHMPPPKGPRIPGFAEGGMVDIMVGERGPEVARVPLGTSVFPGGTSRPGSGSSIVLQFNVNGTAVEAAQKIKKIIMDELKNVHQFSAVR